MTLGRRETWFHHAKTNRLVMASNLKLQQLQLRSFRTQSYGKRKKNAIKLFTHICPSFVLFFVLKQIAQKHTNWENIVLCFCVQGYVSYQMDLIHLITATYFKCLCDIHQTTVVLLAMWFSFYFSCVNINGHLMLVFGKIGKSNC